MAYWSYRLKSNIDLHVLKNAIVLFTPDKTQYPLLSPDEGTSGSRCQSPISAYHESNFSITGEGVFVVTENSGVRSSVLRLAMQNGIVL